MGGKTDYLGYIDIAKLDEHLDEYGTPGAFGGQRTTRLVCGKADPSRYTEADQRAAKRGGKSSHRFGLYVGDM